MDCTFCNIRDFFEKGSYYKQEKTLIRYIINTLSCLLYRTNVFLHTVVVFSINSYSSSLRSKLADADKPDKLRELRCLRAGIRSYGIAIPLQYLS